jgi:mannosyltransferase
MNFFRRKNDFWPNLKPLDIAALVSAIVAYVAITGSTLTKFSIWFDEAFGSYLIRFNYFDLTRYTAYDVHPPFYYWMLKTWSMLFGNTEIGIRSMSVFFGIITIIFIFMFVMKYFGRRAAYLSLLFLILTPLFIRYSQEARMYTLLTAIVAAATYILLYAEQTSRRWAWITYGVLVAIGMLTQYFAALAWAAHWVWRGLILSKKGPFLKRYFTRNWILAHIAAFLVFLPWLPWLIRQFVDVQGNGFWIPSITSATIPDYLTTVLVFGDHNSVKGWLAVGAYAVVVSMIVFVAKLMPSLKSKHVQPYLLILCLVVVPVVLLLIMSLPPLRPAFIDRYLLPAALFIPVLAAVTITLSMGRFSKNLLVITIGLITIVLSAGIYNQSIVGNYNKNTNQSNNIRQLIEEIRAQPDNGGPIVANTPWVFYEASIYETNNSPLYFVNETTTYKFGSLRMLKENDDHKILDVDAFAREHQSFWIISNVKDSTPNKLRESWLVSKEIVVNDTVSDKPLFKAIRVSAE